MREALTELARTRSSRTIVITRNALARAIRHAEANDRVRRNVAALVSPPKGRPGRPSKAMNLEQARVLLGAAEGTRIEAYVVVSLTTGARTEELRALRFTSSWTATRTQTRPCRRTWPCGVPCAVMVTPRIPKSRRTLALPESAVSALAEHRRRQAAERLAAGPLWQDHKLVFASAVGTPLDASHVRRSLRAICRKAGIGEDWAPRDLRHIVPALFHVAIATVNGEVDLRRSLPGYLFLAAACRRTRWERASFRQGSPTATHVPLNTASAGTRHTFVSLMSSFGEVPVEEIAHLVDHSSTQTTETVYRHELRPVIRTGAEVLDRLFSNGRKG